MCQHDETYRIENEQNGGTGCPLCNAQKALEATQKAQGDAQHADDGCFIPGCATIDCSDCYPENCAELAALEAQAADWEDQRAEQAHPWQN